MMKPPEKTISVDGSKKYRLRLEGERAMEAAFFHVAGRARPNIACISTQIGCAVGCPFCATTQEGFYRNLTVDEMLLEVSSILDEALAEGMPESSFEVSFMGMGEPLANLSNLLSAIEGIHQRYPEITRVSVSTAGPARRIDALTACMPVAPPVHLQISLHATDDETRRKLIPNAPEPIAQMLAAGQRFHHQTGDHVCLNYVLLQGINDAVKDAIWLAQLDPQVFYIKVTELNPTAGLPAEFVGATREAIKQFCDVLRLHGMPHKVFIGDGLDVQASCGQMAATPVELRNLVPSILS